ncbi:MAG: DUF87 domain-containing protein [Nitrososphaerota archaeon]|nr:DUF87 domain-containing protein [Nitrososphaerota archaeon]MDG6922275.1 DUF87 domain-containing protein [Nitrososphaerota archaeon]
MIQGNKLSLNIEAAVTKALQECSEDEIALDCMAQWASNPVSKKAGYGIEENYPIILLNLCGRFNISSVIATEYVRRLREYSTQFMLLGGDVDYLREKVLEELRGEAGKKWRQGSMKRFASSSMEIKRLSYLLHFLIRRGFEVKIIESSLDQIQAFYCAAFEKPFPFNDLAEELINSGVVNRMQHTTDDYRKQTANVVSPFFSMSHLRFNASELKVQEDSKDLIKHLLDKKQFAQLTLVDEICSENFGIMECQTEQKNLLQEKKMFGHYSNNIAISPFLLEEIRNNVRSFKKQRLEEYEWRVDSYISKLISDTWPEGKIDYFKMKHEQALWRIDNGTNPKVFVYLALWVNDTEFGHVISKMDIPRSSTLILVLLNQTAESARSVIMGKTRDCGEISMIYPINQKESRVETLAGSISPYSTKLIQTLTKSLNLSDSNKSSSKNASVQAEIGVSAQFGTRLESPKVLLGRQSAREIYWSPSREINQNIAIFGDAKSGKTETIKRILVGLKKSNVPFLVIDCSGEYLLKDQSFSEFGSVVQANDISVNPLELDDANSVREQVYSVLDSFASIFDLSEDEIISLRYAIGSSYSSTGILEDNKHTWTKTPPTLLDVRGVLEHTMQEGEGREKNAAKGVMQKIGELLGNPLFAKPRTGFPFERLVTGPVVVNLSGFSNPMLKSAAAEFLLQKIPSFASNESGELKLFIAVDGLPRLMRSRSQSLRLLREARRRGLGIIYSNQSHVDLPELAFSNTASMLTLRLSDSKSANLLAERFLMKDHGLLNKGLGEKFSAVLKIASQPDYIKFSALPYFQNE